MIDPLSVAAHIVLCLAFWILGYLACRRHFAQRGVSLHFDVVVFDQAKNKAGAHYVTAKTSDGKLPAPPPLPDPAVTPLSIKGDYPWGHRR